MKTHRLVTPEVTFGKDFNIWFLNRFFHMLDLFDKNHKIKEFGLDDEITSLGIIIRQKFGYIETIKPSLKGKRINRTYKKFVYEIKFNEKEIKEDYEEQVKDNTIDITHFELTVMLHELAHLKSFKHNKRFYRILRNYAYKWIGYVKGISSKEAKEIYPNIIKYLK